MTVNKKVEIGQKVQVLIMNQHVPIDAVVMDVLPKKALLQYMYKGKIELRWIVNKRIVNGESPAITRLKKSRL